MCHYWHKQTGVRVPVLLFHQASAPHKCVYPHRRGQKEMSEKSEYPRLEGIIKSNSYPGLGQPPEPQQVNIVQMLPELWKLFANCFNICLTEWFIFHCFCFHNKQPGKFYSVFLVTWIVMCSLEVSWTERKEKLNWNTFQKLSVNASVVNDESLPLTCAVFIVQVSKSFIEMLYKSWHSFLKVGGRAEDKAKELCLEDSHLWLLKLLLLLLSSWLQLFIPLYLLRGTPPTMFWYLPFCSFTQKLQNTHLSAQTFRLLIWGLLNCPLCFYMSPN